MTIENPLYAPRKDIYYDRPQERLNLSEIERWAATPHDFLSLRDWETLPAKPGDYKVGTFIRVGDTLYQQVAGAWVEYGATFPMSIVTATLDLPSLAAQASTNCSGLTVTGVTTGDTLIYLSGLAVNWNGVTVDSVQITGTNTIEMSIVSARTTSLDPSSTLYTFLLIQGLNGP